MIFSEATTMSIIPGTIVLKFSGEKYYKYQYITMTYSYCPKNFSTPHFFGTLV